VKSGSRRRLVFFWVAALFGVAAPLYAQAGEAATASEEYSTARDQLDGRLAGAYTLQYTNSEAADLVREAALVESQAPPADPSERAVFYRQQARALDALRGRLIGIQSGSLKESRGAYAAALQDVAEALAQDQQLEVEPVVLASLQVRLAALRTANPLSVPQYRVLARQAAALAERAVEAGSAQRAELQALQARAAELQVASGGNLEAVRRAGEDALVAGRNDASVAAMLGIGAVTQAYQALEHRARLLGSTEADEIALGAAAALRYSGQVHDALFANLPGKVMIVSLQAQQMWAYENGQLAIQTYVTTGMPALPTPPGLHRITVKYSPYKFVSPWGPGSPYYFDPLWSTYAMLYKEGGYFMHDASWRHVFGPGTQVRGSHGCINLPPYIAGAAFQFADIGTPVVVIPGDGSPVGAQLSQRDD